MGLYFDGSDDHGKATDIEDLLDPTSDDSPFSIEVLFVPHAWASSGNGYRGEIINRQYTTGAHAGFRIGLGGDWATDQQKLGFDIRTTTWQTVHSTADMSLESLHHAVGIYDGADLTVYLDGAQGESEARAGALASGAINTDFAFGYYKDGNARHGNITLLLARFYRGYALSANQVASRYRDSYAMFAPRFAVSPVEALEVSEPAVWIAYRRMLHRNVALRI